MAVPPRTPHICALHAHKLFVFCAATARFPSPAVWLDPHLRLMLRVRQFCPRWFARLYAHKHGPRFPHNAFAQRFPVAHGFRRRRRLCCACLRTHGFHQFLDAAYATLAHLRMGCTFGSVLHCALPAAALSAWILGSLCRACITVACYTALRFGFMVFLRRIAPHRCALRLYISFALPRVFLGFLCCCTAPLYLCAT